MSNSFFQFKQFIIHQDKCAMKVTTDACLFGAWIVNRISKETFPPDRLSQSAKINNCLDIGAGTGLLSFMIAQEYHDANIDAMEIHEETATQAKENADALFFKNRIHVVHADARNYSFRCKYDLIVCNPPFYENELQSPSPEKNIAHHSQSLLLHELLPVIKNNLHSKGFFFLLMPFKRYEEIRKLPDKYEFDLLQMTFVKQSFYHDPFRVMLMGQLHSGRTIITEMDELSIWDENKNYSMEFTELLKDYYLYL